MELQLTLVVCFLLFLMVDTEKCYSCSSPQLLLKWPKDEVSNKLLYLQHFPWFANESCEQVKDALPVVDCGDSVCIKAVIKVPPVERSICETGGAIVRDCWSRVMGSNVTKNPRARRDVVRLAEAPESEITIGLIYTCDGFLCNFGSRSLFFASTAVFLFKFSWIF